MPRLSSLALNAAKQKARCDYAQFLGAGPDNADIVPSLAHKAAGLKMYLDFNLRRIALERYDFLEAAL